MDLPKLDSIDRRRLMRLGIASCSLICMDLTREAVMANTSAPNRPTLTASEQIMHCTVRLEFPDQTGLRTGTGFFYNFFNHEGQAVISIVTNAHVFGFSDVMEFKLTLSDRDGGPKIGTTKKFRINGLQHLVIKHPTLDLAIIPIVPFLTRSIQEGARPFFISLDQSIIPTTADYKSLSPLENVTTVGYPGMLWDDINNIPTFHRGYIATPCYIDFKNKPEFLVDFATWPGASGSPMFLMNEGGYHDPRSGTTLVGGTRLHLLGVVYGVAQQEVTGAVVLQQAPTKFETTPLMAASMVPTNLGACVRADRILDFEPLLAQNGFTIPNGYTMRAR